MARSSLFVREEESDDEFTSSSGKPDVLDPGPYCICNGPEREGDFMIGCDKPGCERWYHGSCIGIAAEFVLDTSRYFCPHCSQSTLGIFTWQEEEVRKLAEQGQDDSTTQGQQYNMAKWDRRAFARTEELVREDMRRTNGKDRATVVMPAEEDGAVKTGVSVLKDEQYLPLRPIMSRAIVSKDDPNFTQPEEQPARSTRKNQSSEDQEDSDSSSEYAPQYTLETATKHRFLAHRLAREEEYDADVSHLLDDETEVQREFKPHYTCRMFNAEEVEKLAAYRLVKAALNAALFK